MHNSSYEVIKVLVEDEGIGDFSLLVSVSLGREFNRQRTIYLLLLFIRRVLMYETRRDNDDKHAVVEV